MIKPELPDNEDKRLEALKEYSILDTMPEDEYNDITRLASIICGTPISLISLVDDRRQWFKSHHGLDATETPKDVAFCAHAINSPNDAFVIPDSREDERFHDNPLVTEDPHVVFYAGIPLVDPDGYALGTLCVIDNKPRKISEEQIAALNALSNQVMKLFELRKTAISLQTHIFELEAQNMGLREFAHTAAHDIKSPLSSIVMYSELLQYDYKDKLDEEANEFIDTISRAGKKLTGLIDGILRYSKDSSLLSKNREDLKIKDLIEGIVLLLKRDEEVKISMSVPEGLIWFSNKIALERILINIVTNSIKYNDKPETKIDIEVIETEDSLKFSICDNGPGIEEADQERIFKLFETTKNIDKRGEHGFGIGLATVKSLVEGLSGKITVESKLGNGVCFRFSIGR